MTVSALHGLSWLSVAALGTAVLAVVLAGAVAARVRSTRPEPEPAGTGYLRDALAAAESQSRLLHEHLTSAQHEARRLRLRLQIATMLDLDAILSHTLESLIAIPGVDGAAILLEPLEPAEEEEPLVAALGVETAEATTQLLRWPYEKDRVRSALVTFRYAGNTVGALRGALVAPLPGEPKPAGKVATFWRSDVTPPDDVLVAMEEVAEDAAPAILNARLYRGAVQRAELDSLTKLHNRRYFHEALDREIARTQRYGRRLAVMLLDVDDFKEINERLGHLAGDTILAEIATRIRAIARATDATCRTGGDEFGIVLPESRALDAEHLYRRLEIALAAGTPVDGLTLSAGIAELEPNDDSTSLFERADAALFRAKRIGKNQVVVVTGPDAADAPAPDATVT